jgi:glycosyltransferase involved in cell wall biosynthesis
MSDSGVTIPRLTDYPRHPWMLDCPKGGRSSGRPGRETSAGLVTVVTVTLNSAATLDRTIDSIAAQTHGRIEYIIVDGGSTDGTPQTLRRREADIDLWVSAPDRGISDAFNRGIALASGEYIALVNSDDWLEADHAARAVSRLGRTDAQFVFGNLMVHEADGKARYAITGDPAYGRRVRHAMPDINHPSVVCRRGVYERHGLYDVGLRIAMDYEWLLRGYLLGVRGEYLQDLTSHMDAGGASHRSAIAGLGEVRDVSVRYGYPRLLAGMRYANRAARTLIRMSLERRVSMSLARRLRKWLHRGYRTCDRDVLGP